MAETFNPNGELTQKELAQHLRKPDGETGKQIGLQMNKGNKYICQNSYKVLNPNSGHNILEIGMGNGFFIKDLLSMANDLNYTGADFSETMVQEATDLNKELIDAGKVKFIQASIEKLPFEDSVFDSITTTNTVYFWPQVEANAKELLRVLKPNGKLLIAYRSKAFLNQLELSNYGFTKYNLQDVESILSKSGFKQVETQTINEPELEFSGKVLQMEGFYTIAIK